MSGFLQWPAIWFLWLKSSCYLEFFSLATVIIWAKISSGKFCNSSSETALKFSSGPGASTPGLCHRHPQRHIDRKNYLFYLQYFEWCNRFFQVDQFANGKKSSRCAGTFGLVFRVGTLAAALRSVHHRADSLPANGGISASIFSRPCLTSSPFTFIARRIFQSSHSRFLLPKALRSKRGETTRPPSSPS